MEGFDNHEYKFNKKKYYIKYSQLNEKIEIIYENNSYYSNYSLDVILNRIKDEFNKIGK